jgi:hypothetical protein
VAVRKMAHVSVIDVASYEATHRTPGDHIRSEVFLLQFAPRSLSRPGYTRLYRRFSLAVSLPDTVL